MLRTKAGRAAVEKYLKEGASASLNKTIQDLQHILEGRRIPMPRKMRARLYDLLQDYGEKWYRTGFRRALRTVDGLDPSMLMEVKPFTVRREVHFLGKANQAMRRARLKYK
jgi:hypothetical protein